MNPNYRGQYGDDIYIVATAAGAVAAFADMTGETAAAATGRVLLVTAIVGSGAGAFSVGVRVTDGATPRVVYPRSGDIARIGDGQRHFVDDTFMFRVNAGERLQWISAEGVAKEISLRCHQIGAVTP